MPEQRDLVLLEYIIVRKLDLDRDVKEISQGRMIELKRKEEGNGWALSMGVSVGTVLQTEKPAFEKH